MNDTTMNDYNMADPENNGSYVRDWDRWKNDMEDAVGRLEERYKDRNLKFTSPFVGSVPVQAFGHIDGFIFYFRYRWDCGQLRVGFVEDGRYDLEYDRDIAFWKERVAKHSSDKESGNALDDAWSQIYLAKPVKKVVNGVDDMPTTICKNSVVGDYLNDQYNGSLTPTQCEDLFIKLVELLQEFEENDYWVEPVTIEFDPSA